MNFAGLVHSAAVAVVVASALAGASRPALAGARAEAHSQAGRPAPTALQVTAQRPGTVIGTVLGPNHRPLPGVCVTATPLGRPASPATPATPGGRTAVTSRTGTFALPGLAQGAYSLAYRRCTGPDGQVSWPEAALRPSALLAPQRPSTAFVTGGRLTMLGPVTVGPVELTAPRPSHARPRPGDPIALGEISGTVTSPSGHGVAQECVGLFDPQGNGIAVTLTSKQGAYHLKGLLAGRYGVQFFTDQVCGKPNRYLAQWWPGTANETKRGLIRLRKGAHRNHIDAKLVVGATITGTVRLGGPRGRPLSGMCAFASIGRFGAPIIGATGRHGHYAILGLPAGRYTVQFGPGCNNNGNFLSASFPHPVGARLGQVTSHVDGVLQLGAEINGTITDRSSGAPLRGICVSVDNGVAMAATSKNGTFFAKQIPPGRYPIKFTNCDNTGSFAPQFYPGQLNAAAAGRVTFASGKLTSRIDAAMTPGGTITGSLRSPSGAKLNNACIAVVPAADLQGGGPVTLGFLAQFGISANGRYSVRNLAAGRFQVAFGTCVNGPNFADQFFLGQGDFTRADAVSLGAGRALAGIDATVQPGGTITGVVEGPPNQGDPEENLFCVSATNARTGALAVEQTATDLAGRYTIGALATGSYVIDFEPCGGQNLLGTRIGPVRVTGGQVAHARNASARLGAIIKGQVTSAPSGQPLPGACVGAVNQATQAFLFGTSNRRGEYVVTSLPAGRYRMIVTSCDGKHLLPVQTAAVTAVIGRTAIAPTARVRTYVPGSISGQVRSAVPSSGAPGVCVDIIPVRGSNLGNFGSGAAAGRHGYYEVGGLIPGRYQVFFGDPFCDTDPGNLIPEWYDAKPTEASATVITVKAGRVTRPVSAALRPEGGISGTVTGPGGTPVAGICVRARSRGSDAASFLAITSSTGGYQLGSLRPGRYVVEFRAGCGAFGYDSLSLKSPVLVRSGQIRSGIDATLARQK